MKDINYETGEECAGLPEECDEKGFVGSVDVCLTCPNLCCLENRNNEYEDRIPLKTLRKLKEKSNR